MILSDTRWLRAIGGGVVLSGWLLGCADGQLGEQPLNEQPLNEQRTPFVVEYAGCTNARMGPVCELRDVKPLTLWVPAATADVKLEFDGVASSWPESKPVQEGFRIELDVPEGTRQVAVQRSPDGARWSLSLQVPVTPPWQAKAQTLVQERKYDEATAWLETTLETVGNDRDRGRVLSLLGQLALQRGETSVALDLLNQCLPFLRRAGDFQVEIGKATVLIYSLIVQQYDFTAARELLEGLPLDWQAPGESRYFEAFYWGLLAMSTGNARGALEHLERAVEIAERTGVARYSRATEELVAVQLQRLGRYEEASASLHSLLEQAVTEGDSCRQAGLLSNLGLNALHLREVESTAKAPGGPDPRRLLERALEILDTECADDLPERQNTLLNLARAELQAQRYEAARVALRKAAEVPVETGIRLVLWWREVEGHLALAEGRSAAALAIFESLRQAADTALVPDAQWRAYVGMAQSRRALNDLEGALEAFRFSEQQLDSELLLVPLQEGRESFLAQRERATAQHLELLLEGGRVAEALALARNSRVRLLRYLNQSIRLQGLGEVQRVRWEGLVAAYQDERKLVDQVAANDWALAADSLAAIRRQRADARQRLARAVDETFAVLETEASVATSDTAAAGATEPLVDDADSVALVFHPLADGWVLFVHRAGETETYSPGCQDESPRALATCLLEHAEAQIVGASEIRILATGVLSGVDFQNIPLAGDILLSHAPIVYDLDLGTAALMASSQVGEGSPESTGPSTALIVADPAGDLPRARQEAAAVQEILRPHGQVSSLQGQQASASALAAALPSVQLLHFAGHARFSGRGGWQTFMPLAGGGQLTLEDILLLARPPQWVVLSGCETARTARDRTVASNVGLAQAFLAAGTQTVIAAVRPVADDLAAELVAKFYPAWLAGATPALALQQAQQELRQQQPDADWASFRVIER